MLRYACYLLFVLSLSCATRGRDFPSDMSWIKKDITKKSDVKQLLGEPYQVGYSSGQATWTYGYYRFRLFGDSNTKELKLYWNRSGQVDNFSFTSSFPDDLRKSQIPASNEPAANLPE